MTKASTIHHDTIHMVLKAREMMVKSAQKNLIKMVAKPQKIPIRSYYITQKW